MLYNAMMSGLLSVYDYLSLHVLACLVPAFFIAGAVAVFVSKQSVIRYFSSETKKFVSYSIASISGTVLAVCSCTILPLFAGIYKRGAGIGPTVSLPSMLVLQRIMGTTKTTAFITLAVLISTLVGFAYGKVVR